MNYAFFSVSMFDTAPGAQQMIFFQFRGVDNLNEDDELATGPDTELTTSTEDVTTIKHNTVEEEKYIGGRKKEETNMKFFCHFVLGISCQ